MPLYMDVHIIPGVKAREVAEAHRKDMLIQNEHECKCMTYWIDEERENVFCLIEAPDKSAVEEMHHRAHGLIPHKIIEVNSGLVQSFLGRIYDPEQAETTSDGLRVFHDPSFRILLVASVTDPVLMRHRFGKDRAAMIMQSQNEIIRRNLAAFEGSEVEHDGHWFIASFTSASRAVSCALAIQHEIALSPGKEMDLKIGIHAGEPVSKTDQLFGNTIRMARLLCGLQIPANVSISPAVTELVTRDYGQHKDIFHLSPQDEHFLDLLFDTLEKNWQEPDFNIPDFCKAMAMSKSQLYRKCTELLGESPNDILKDFRLDKAKEMMRKSRVPVSQATFDAGFTSPSYFTKCFKKKFELLPLNYLELV